VAASIISDKMERKPFCHLPKRLWRTAPLQAKYFPEIQKIIDFLTLEKCAMTN
jgi:hypothetical protein